MAEELDRAAIKAERVHGKDRVKVIFGKGQLARYIQVQRDNVLPKAARGEFLIEQRGRVPQVNGDHPDAKMLRQKYGRGTPAAAQIEHNIASAQSHRSDHPRSQVERAAADRLVIDLFARVARQL